MKVSGQLVYDIAIQLDRVEADTYHRGNEVPRLLRRGRARLLLIARRKQIVDGEQAIAICFGCLAFPGLLE